MDFMGPKRTNFQREILSWAETNSRNRGKIIISGNPSKPVELQAGFPVVSYSSSTPVSKGLMSSSKQTLTTHSFPVHSYLLPSTAFVEKKAKFFVSNGFSLVNSVLRLWGSDSPVSEELSTLKPRDSIILISAGIRSPNLTSTTSPSTRSSARTVSFSPSRITVANWKSKISYQSEIKPLTTNPATSNLMPLTARKTMFNAWFNELRFMKNLFFPPMEFRLFTCMAWLFG